MADSLNQTKLLKKDYILLHIKQYFSSNLYAIRYIFYIFTSK